MKRGRKSSNNTFTENGKKIWKCGKYKRLSKEDGHDVSYSIENQKQILQDFARRHYLPAGRLSADAENGRGRFDWYDHCEGPQPLWS